MAVYDDIIFKVVRDAEADLEQRLDADVMYFNAEIRMNIFSWFREVIEKLALRPGLGTMVTTAEKQARANEIAKLLSNNAHWHSHGRLIGIRTLKECRLDIDDFGRDIELQTAIRTYNDALSDYLARVQIRNFLYSRHVN